MTNMSVTTLNVRELIMVKESPTNFNNLKYVAINKMTTKCINL